MWPMRRATLRLKKSLTYRMKALLTKREALSQIAESEQISTIEGLSQPELYVLAEVCGEIYMPESGVSVGTVKHGVERAGPTALGFSLGIRRLIKRGFVEVREDTNYNGDQIDAIFLTENAWAWIEADENLFMLRSTGLRLQHKNHGRRRSFLIRPFCSK
jgi:hypothetical protein